MGAPAQSYQGPSGSCSAKAAELQLQEAGGRRQEAGAAAEDRLSPGSVLHSAILPVASYLVAATQKTPHVHRLLQKSAHAGEWIHPPDDEMIFWHTYRAAAACGSDCH
ncbi:unnamed protein product [Pleuronectes platessa]|uniref:Uncharacterized protein n=1 Tax=Pleuronectes platessa TaxID=8262 RepID=A0A9N7UCX5_PLEPL|nr:unnamed protein product [Pleuronectes platessa]